MNNKKEVNDILSLLSSKVQDSKDLEAVISFHEYLDKVIDTPWITRNTKQLMNDMIHRSGIDYEMVPGSTLKQKYSFFEDADSVDQYIVFGQGKAKSNLVEKISNASKGMEASKRLWILLGPPGSAKSRSMDAIKTALYKYSSSDEGAVYTVLLPTLDERLSDKTIPDLKYEGNDDIKYIQSPCFETPLQLVPSDLRKDFCNSVNEKVNQESLSSFYDQYPHYDNKFEVDERGLASPYAERVIKDFCRSMNGISIEEALKYVKVKRMVYDAKTKNGIGSYTPRDEKSQEAGSLVGNIDYSLLPKFGSESHPLVHDYKGELCVGANGFVEIHEILKLSDKFLYELLFATQDRFFKPEGQDPVPFNGVIIGHTNFHEYENFMENQSFEALRSRTNFIEMPLSINYKEEKHIYTNVYSNEKRNWSEKNKNMAHVSPHVFELMSIVSAMTRILPSKKGGEKVSLLQKALIHAGNAESGVDNNLAELIMEEFEYHTPTEGTFGLDPRFMQNVFEKTEHAQLSEYAANIEKLKEVKDDESFAASISLVNPCITPMDIYIKLEHMIKDIFSNDRATLDKYMNEVLPKAKEWCIGQITSDVYSAILKDNTIIQNTWKKYCDHVRAFTHNTKVKHEITMNQIDPDEKFMEGVENYIAVPDRETFRKELSDAISAVGANFLISNTPHYESAIKQYVFNNEFRNGDSQKLLGWVKSGSSAASINDKEQQQFNDALQYLINEKSYCGKCAYDAMVIAANSHSIV